MIRFLHPIEVEFTDMHIQCVGNPYPLIVWRGETHVTPQFQYLQNERSDVLGDQNFRRIPLSKARVKIDKKEGSMLSS